ncbi:MAG TPA: hypothetical protein VFD27_22515, partial [Chthoniobacteraceae bacterium]|nr:hypothetical protein [Chthoniobacteraceae bacterium]
MKLSSRSSADAGRQISADGSVLIIVLLVSLGLVSVTLLFAHSMVMSLRGSDNDLAGHQAEEAIEGAARYAQLLMTNVEKPGTFPDIITYDSEELPVGEASVWFIGQNPLPDTDTVPVFGLVDEAGKLNLNATTTTKEMLEALPGMTVELAAAIIDWRDTDSDVTQNGAESETYLRKQPAYECKNADFESVQELALLNGADPLVLYGEDANLNGVLDPNEDDGDKSAPPDNSDGKLDPGILAYVTVFSREPNTQSDGSTPRVLVTNPNTAVRDLLRDTFGESRAEAIMDRLAGGSAGGGARFNSTLQFFMSSGMTADEFAQISDSITTSSEPFVTGLINVNTASEAVLATIPGIGDKASSLVAARLSRAQQDTNIAWVVDVLGEEGVTQAGRYLTGRSYQVSADIAAVGRHGRGYRRTRFVIDSS